MRRRHWAWYKLCIVVCFAVLMICGSAPTEAATTNKVTFYENNGTSNSTVQKLNKTVKRGTEIELPALPAPKGFVNLGWTTTKAGTNPFYKNGTKYLITKDTKFYLVQRKLYNVSFVDMDGKTNSFFKSLNKSIRYGKTVTLPESASKKGYTFLGWSLKKNSTKADYVAGTQYEVKKATKFYAVYVQNFTVSYLSNDGSKVYRKVTLKKGEKTVIAGRKNEKNGGYTFLGWSETPLTKINPLYEVGSVIRVDRELKLYAVQYKKSNEPNYTEKNMPVIDTNKYTKVIFVGDSRTYRAKQTLQNECSSSKWKNSKFVAKGGATLEWFDEVGYAGLIKEVGKGGTVQKPIAVIFNLGVNDMERLTEYISRMKKIEPYLSKKNCKLFYMSVNPVNNAIILAQKRKNRPEKQLLNFNNTIRSQLCMQGKFTYINTFSYLKRAGYGFDSGRGVDTGIEDGIHYTTRTYKRIYAYAIKTLNNL